MFWDGREFSYSDITVHSDIDPGLHTWESATIFRSVKWVFLRAGTERINLRQFKHSEQARKYAREVRLRVTVTSGKEPWFPLDD